MKIVKQVDTANWKYNFTCSKCDTELEASASDIKHHHYDGDVREPPNDTFYVNCPVCNLATSIAKEKIPKALQVQVTNKKTTTGGNGYWDR